MPTGGQAECVPKAVMKADSLSPEEPVTGPVPAHGYDTCCWTPDRPAHISIAVASHPPRGPPLAPGSLRWSLPHRLEAGVAVLLHWPPSLSPAALEVTPSPAHRVGSWGPHHGGKSRAPSPLGTFGLLRARGLRRWGLVCIRFLGRSVPVGRVHLG